jgi:hypothetical protein
MSYFAELDENNVVIRVLVGDDNLPNEGLDWFTENLGGTWMQTSFTGQIRKNFAGIGYSYDPERDAFIPRKPFNSWILNEETCVWMAPSQYPSDELTYSWNEGTTNWELADFSEQDPSLEA